jgi:hypothetical protein
VRTITLLIKDAQNQQQPIATQSDIAANLVPVHVPASVIAGVATPVSAANPLPVEVAAGSPAIDGSGTIVSATVAQTLFAGVVPATGFQIANNCASVIYVRDTGSPAGAFRGHASAGGWHLHDAAQLPPGRIRFRVWRNDQRKF